MIYPFRPRENFDELAEKFYPACQHIQPFQIRFNLINRFQHCGENFILWLAPEPKELVIDIQTALLNMLLDCDDVTRLKNGFTPHLSIGQVKGKTAMLKLKDALQTSWEQVSFMVIEICFIWRNEPPDNVFRVSHKVKLIWY